MTDIAVARTAVASVLSERMTGVRVYSAWPGQLNPPAIVIRRQAVTFATTLGGASHDLTLAATVFLPLRTDRIAQDELDEFLADTGTRSIYAAIEADQTLGGAVDWAVVTEVGQDDVVEISGVTYLSGTATIQVG